MNTITVSDFEKEMTEIDKIQEQVSEWINSKNIFIRYFNFGLGKTMRLHDEAGRRMKVLFSKELIED